MPQATFNCCNITPGRIGDLKICPFGKMPFPAFREVWGPKINHFYVGPIQTCPENCLWINYATWNGHQKPFKAINPDTNESPYATAYRHSILTMFGNILPRFRYIADFSRRTPVFPYHLQSPYFTWKFRMISWSKSVLLCYPPAKNWANFPYLKNKSKLYDQATPTS